MLVPITSLIASSSKPEDPWQSQPGLCPWTWVIAAAPLAGASLWLIATATSYLYWTLAGSIGPLNWCRSGAGLLAAGALTMTALVTASLLQWLEERRPRAAAVAQPDPTGTTAGSWRLDEGQFTTT